jgi:hypothetical protein
LLRQPLGVLRDPVLHEGGEALDRNDRFRVGQAERVDRASRAQTARGEGIPAAPDPPYERSSVVPGSCAGVWSAPLRTRNPRGRRPGLAAPELEVDIWEPVSLPWLPRVIPLARLLEAGGEIPYPRPHPPIQSCILRPEPSLAQRARSDGWAWRRPPLVGPGRVGFVALLEPLTAVTTVPAGVSLPRDALVSVPVQLGRARAATRQRVFQPRVDALTLG